MKKFFIKVINSIGLYTHYKCNTINMIGFSGERCTGRTTRLADAYIQLLFATGEINVRDHFKNKQSDICLRNVILNRLQMEHGNAYRLIQVCENYIQLDLRKIDSEELRRLRLIDYGKQC